MVLGAVRAASLAFLAPLRTLHFYLSKSKAEGLVFRAHIVVIRWRWRVLIGLCFFLACGAEGGAEGKPLPPK